MISGVLSNLDSAVETASLRGMLASCGSASKRAYAASALGANVGAWLATHQRSAMFFVDVHEGASSLLWQREWDLPKARQEMGPMQAPSAMVACEALIEMNPSAGAYRRAAAVATLCGDDLRSLQITHRGLLKLTQVGRVTTLELARAFSSSRLGMFSDAIGAYRSVGMEGSPEERCNALFSGALVAADCNASDSVDWFLDRLKGEEPAKSERWMKAIARTRANREGVESTSQLLLSLGESFPTLLQAGIS